MPIPLLANLDAGGNARIQNLPNAVSAQEPVTLAQVTTSLGPLGINTGDFFLGNNDWTPLLHSVASGTIAYSEAQDGMVVSGTSVTATIRCRIPVDPDTFYLARVKLKKVSGTGTIYIGAKSLDNSFVNLATDTLGSFNYFVANNAALAVGNTAVFEGSIGGYNPASPTGGLATKFDPKAKYWDLVIIANYNGSGDTAIQSIEIKKARFGQRFDGTVDIAGSIRLLAPTATLPTAGGSAAYLVGSDGASNSGRLIVGDGSGWNFKIVSRTGSADTLRFTFTDTGGFTATGTVTANAFSGNGATLTNLDASNLASGTVPDARFPATLPAVSGTNLTNLNATNLASGTVADDRLSTEVVLKNTAAVMTAKFSTVASTTSSAGLNIPHGVAPSAPVNGDMWTTTGGAQLRLNGSTVTYLFTTSGLNATNLTSGTVPLARLSNIADAQIAAAAAIGWTKISKVGSSLADLATRSASDLDSGTLPDARFPATLPAVSGVNLTNLNASNLASGTVADARLSANVSKLDTDETRTGKITTVASAAGKAGLNLPHGVAPTTPVDGDVWTTSTAALVRITGVTRSFLLDNSALNAANLTGTLPALDGAALTNLNASNLASGTVALARLANIADAQIAAAAAIAWTKISKTGSSLADLTTRSATDLTSGTLPDARFPATLPALSGVNLTALNASNLASGTVADARLSAQVVLKNVAAVMTAKLTTVAPTTGSAGFNLAGGVNPTTPADGDLWYNTTQLQLRIGATSHILLSHLSNLNANNMGSGTLPDARFPATLPAVSGVNLTALNASNLASGTVPDARFPATLPALSGANLTNLNATNLASGTVADARLSAQVVLKNTAAVMTAKFSTVASATGSAGLNIPHGVAPTAPVDGDVWTTTTAALVRINAATRTFLLDNSSLNAANLTGTLPALDGAALTNLNATNLASGTVALARLANIADAQIAAAAAIAWTKISKTGSSLADLTTRSATDLTSGTLPDARFPATLPALSGVNLTALNGTNIASGTVADARLSAQVVLKNVAAVMTAKLSTVASATGSAGLNVPHGVAPTSPVNGDIWTTTAAALVRINAATRTFLLDNSSLAAANLTGTLPAISGVNLTALNASNLGSGTVPLARLAGITNTEIAAAAGIVDTKLATISTPGKVANAATTGTSSPTATTLALRDGAGRAQFADPSAAQDAATKAYVDSLIAGAQNDGLIYAYMNF